MGFKTLISGSLSAFSFLQAELPPRPPADATRQEIREYRLAVRQARREMRDAARREDNIVIGIAPSYIGITHDAGGDPRVEEALPVLGVTAAYRTHFKPKLGIKAGSQFFTGTSEVTWIDRSANPYDYGYPEESRGSRGSTYGINTSVQLILGPFGRFAIEPGAGITWGGRSADTVVLSGGAGDILYRQESHYSFYNGVLGASLFLGSRDQMNISPALIVGFSPARRDDVQFQFTLGLTYAFRIEKEDG
ncbi:MAG TPA: hypothetical protein VJ385_00010 [Fibrobacteria bacterium]|nr:hypothetical protein [Fibrobacteria bacterium]